MSIGTDGGDLLDTSKERDGRDRKDKAHVESEVH